MSNLSKMSVFGSLPKSNMLCESGADNNIVEAKLDEIAAKILKNRQKHGYITVECGQEATEMVCQELRKKHYSVGVRPEFGDKYFYEIQW